MTNPSNWLLVLTLSLAVFSAGCDRSTGDQHAEGEPADRAHAQAGHQHSEADGHDHEHEHADDDHGADMPLGSTQIGGMDVKLWQGHGSMAPGKELHLLVKLPYTDSGATTVRAWLGTQDRLSSVVAKAQYSASGDNYDVHAAAPDPLPESTMWWIEVEKPDGQKAIGSIQPR